MKKIISALLLLSSILVLSGLGYVANAKVAIGSRSEEVKIIQEILKTDPEIYPEGYVTGYYGPLTMAAVKRLQKKCGLPETGILDPTTEKCIYPIGYRVKVIYPNGGEVLDRNQIQTIRWEVIRPSKEPGPGIPEMYPFWPMVSIDLFRKIKVPVICKPCPPEGPCPECPTEESIFVRHIAIANLFDQTYSWKIANDIPNSSDYVIRISIGKGIVPIWIQEKTKVPTLEIRTQEIWPKPPPVRAWIDWDESDGTFEITEEVKPIPNLDEVIEILEKIIGELQRAIALLKRIGY